MAKGPNKNLEIACGLHKGHKVTKYKSEKPKPSRVQYVS